MILIRVQRNKKTKFNIYKIIIKIKINTLIKLSFLIVKIILIIVYKSIKMTKRVKTVSYKSVIKIVKLKLRKQTKMKNQQK